MRLVHLVVWYRLRETRLTSQSHDYLNKREENLESHCMFAILCVVKVYNVQCYNILSKMATAIAGKCGYVCMCMCMYRVAQKK